MMKYYWYITISPKSRDYYGGYLPDDVIKKIPHTT